MALLSEITPIETVLYQPHGLLEGPRFDGDDVLYSDVTSGGVWRLSDCVIEPVVPKRRGVGGLVLHADGGVIVGGRTLIHVSPGGQTRVLHDGTGVEGFNDLTVAPDGAVLVGALRFKPMQGEQPTPGLLLRIGAGGVTTVISETPAWPNGIGYAPGGQRIYVSDFSNGDIITMRPGGADERVFTQVPAGSADGLAVDVEGGVWVALGQGGGIARFTPEGFIDDIVDLHVGFVSSLSFGGEDGRDVLITTADNGLVPDAGGVVLRARSAVASLPIPRAVV
jgi:sugar lactone lactonase YvrE